MGLLPAHWEAAFIGFHLTHRLPIGFRGDRIGPDGGSHGVSRWIVRRPAAMDSAITARAL